tara:strand:- start:3774 stop:4625 length:852 start_codon:yes stop_codon:yes gene_type:complete
MGIHTDLLKFYNVSKTRGWAILAENSQADDRKLKNNPERPETRGRKPLLSARQLKQADRFLQDAGWDARVLTWEQLAHKLDFGVSGRTMKRALGSLDYRKCIACTEGWVSARNAEKRRDDEKHFESAHTWAAVGHKFKSALSFYNVPGNKNGNLTLTVYRDQIPEPLVKPWLDRGDRFILEEDNDSGHGGGSKNNIVVRWKEKHELDHYFNCSLSADLSPIENCWQPPKQYMKKYPYWDEFEKRELAHEGWQMVSQDFINERVGSMLKRLQTCLEMDGRMTGY